MWCAFRLDSFFPFVSFYFSWTVCRFVLFESLHTGKFFHLYLFRFNISCLSFDYLFPALDLIHEKAFRYMGTFRCFLRLVSVAAIQPFLPRFHACELISLFIISISSIFFFVQHFAGSFWSSRHEPVIEFRFLFLLQYLSIRSLWLMFTRSV